ncbi:MAG TPA: DUF2497 domain-containing protein [Caulobacteraceae bacterium]|nr:DUF2497 domain-containing protein [Caulobacteraceae bacterium]
MSEQPAPEPTMEEILASIRRIISEDDAPAGEAEAPAAAAPSLEPMEAAAPPPPAPAPELEDDVLELTDRVDGPAPAQTLGDLEINPLPEFHEAPEPELPAIEQIEAKLPPGPPKPEPAPIGHDEPLVGDPAAHAAALAFGRLSGSMLMPAAGRTLEDVVRELLRPLLKDWLDENLPSIVQATVDQEVERIARGRVR